MKKILLTGGSGLLASNWAVLQRNNYHVIIGVHEKIIKIEGVKTAILHLDNFDSFEADVIKLKPDIIIHTAAISDVEFCEKNPKQAYHVNVKIASTVAEVCATHRIKMVHISTDHLFDGMQPLVSEEAVVLPINVYAKTKAQAEALVLYHCPDSLVIRTNFFGWGPSYRNSFSDTIIQGLREGKTLNLFNDIYYSPIIISELVRITHILIEKFERGIFHISGNERVTKYEFGMKLATAFELDTSNIIMGSISNLNELVRRPIDMSLSNNKVNFLLTDPVASISQQLIKLRQEEELGIAAELKNISSN